MSTRKLGFSFIPIPTSIYLRGDLTLVDKVIVGRVLSFAGPCFIAQDTLASELRVGRQYVNARLKLLVSMGIISSKRGRYGKVYTVNPDVAYSGHLEQEPPKPQFPDVAYSGHLKEEMSPQMSPTVDVRCSPQATQVEVLVEKKNSIESSGSLSGTEKTQNPDDLREPGTSAYADLLKETSATIQDIATLDSIGNPHRERLTKTPDDAILRGIIEPWRRHGLVGLRDWLQLAGEKRIGSKWKGPGFAFFKVDSERTAETWNGPQSKKAAAKPGRWVMYADGDKWEPATEAKPEPKECRCKGKGYLLTVSDNVLRRETIECVYAYPCQLCETGRAKTEAELKAAEDKAVERQPISEYYGHRRMGRRAFDLEGLAEANERLAAVVAANPQIAHCPKCGDSGTQLNEFGTLEWCPDDCGWVARRRQKEPKLAASIDRVSKISPGSAGSLEDSQLITNGLGGL